MEIPWVITKGRKHLWKLLREFAHNRPVFLTRAIHHHLCDALRGGSCNQFTTISGKSIILQMIVGVVEAHSHHPRLMFLREVPNLFLHARERALTVLGQLMKDA